MVSIPARRRESAWELGDEGPEECDTKGSDRKRPTCVQTIKICLLHAGKHFALVRVLDAGRANSKDSLGADARHVVGQSLQ